MAAETACRNPLCDKTTGNEYILYCPRWMCQLHRSLMATCAAQTKDRATLEQERRLVQVSNGADSDDEEEVVIHLTSKKRVVDETTGKVDVLGKALGLDATSKPKRDDLFQTTKKKRDEPTRAELPDTRDEGSLDPFQIPKKKKREDPRLRRPTDAESKEEPIVSDADFQIPKKKRDDVRSSQTDRQTDQIPDVHFHIPKKKPEDRRERPESRRQESKAESNGDSAASPRRNPFQSQTPFERRGSNNRYVHGFVQPSKKSEPPKKNDIVYQPGDPSEQQKQQQQQRKQAAGASKYGPSSSEVHLNAPMPSPSPTSTPTSRRIVFHPILIQPASRNLKRVGEPTSILRKQDSAPPSAAPSSSSTPQSASPPASARSKSKISFNDYKSRQVSSKEEETEALRINKERPRDPRRAPVDPRQRATTDQEHSDKSEKSAPSDPRQRTSANQERSEKAAPSDPRKRQIDNAAPPSDPRKRPSGFDVAPPEKRPRIDVSMSNEIEEGEEREEEDMDIDDDGDGEVMVARSKYSKSSQSEEEDNSMDNIFLPNPFVGDDNGMDVYVENDGDAGGGGGGVEYIEEETIEEEFDEGYRPLEYDSDVQYDIVWLLSQRVHNLLTSVKGHFTKKTETMAHLMSLVNAVNAIEESPTRIVIEHQDASVDGWASAKVIVGGQVWFSIRQQSSLHSILKVLLPKLFEESWVWYMLTNNVKSGLDTKLDRALERCRYKEFHGRFDEGGNRIYNDEGSRVMEDGSTIYYKCIYRLQLGVGQHVDPEEAKQQCYSNTWTRLQAICDRISYSYSPATPVPPVLPPPPATNATPSSSAADDDVTKVEVKVADGAQEPPTAVADEDVCIPLPLPADLAERPPPREMSFPSVADVPPGTEAPQPAPALSNSDDESGIVHPGVLVGPPDQGMSESDGDY
ncbi:unnamed protein product [Aphanomyces euteiches]|nr:hypothetical protein AeRB84_013297 [Aphanomyces euteiches]